MDFVGESPIKCFSGRSKKSLEITNKYRDIISSNQQQ